ncbi:uncharacterized protein LOC118429594 [Branchiostoma floridae]|uniref:Uncharacterized protein LOC118429594 n=1 Tax=Branchiostoma floridae TaxID=7739 RepID=A0A9J7M7W8_BRAFL|nr:uncharacterized protein LOC118429594 [Branchiostoma floridae]
MTPPDWSAGGPMKCPARAELTPYHLARLNDSRVRGRRPVTTLILTAAAGTTSVPCSAVSRSTGTVHLEAWCLTPVDSIAPGRGAWPDPVGITDSEGICAVFRDPSTHLSWTEAYVIRRSELIVCLKF